MIKRNIEYWVKHPGYEVLAGEPIEVTYEIIRRLLAQKRLKQKKRKLKRWRQRRMSCVE